VEVIIDLLDLGQVFILHLPPCGTLLAWSAWVREEDLVDDNISYIYFLFSKFNCESLGLVHTQEFRDAYCHKGRLFRILELRINLLNFGLHSIHGIEQLLVNLLRILLLTLATHHAIHPTDHATKFLLKFNKLQNTLLQNLWEVQQS